MSPAPDPEHPDADWTEVCIAALLDKEDGRRTQRAALVDLCERVSQWRGAPGCSHADVALRDRPALAHQLRRCAEFISVTADEVANPRFENRGGPTA
jgi:hypothetical protein